MEMSVSGEHKQERSINPSWSLEDDGFVSLKDQAWSLMETVAPGIQKRWWLFLNHVQQPSWEYDA